MRFDRSSFMSRLSASKPSSLTLSGVSEDDLACPICAEDFTVQDLRFQSCPCDYKVLSPTSHGDPVSHRNMQKSCFLILFLRTDIEYKMLQIMPPHTKKKKKKKKGESINKTNAQTLCFVLMILSLDSSRSVCGVGIR